VATQAEPNCASCRLVFTREFVMSVCPSFIKTFKESREKYLLERELALMPETQAEVVKERVKRKATEDLGDLRKQMRELKNKINRVSRMSRTGEVEEETDEEEEEDDVVEMGSAAARVVKATRKTRTTVVCRCPAEKCRGFVTDSDYKCGLCSLLVCKDCSLIVAEGHTCKKEDLESATLLKKSSKPCPKCATPIFKIDGCDQMWCTQCKTAFSWNTGMIETGRVHNPHFYEWQRQMHNGEAPRVPGDVPPPCANQEVSYYRLLRMIPSHQTTDDPSRTSKRLSDMHQYMIHLEGNNCALPRPLNNTPLRVKYLLGEIDEKTLAFKLQKADKLFQKNTEVCQVYQAVVEGAKAIFQEISVAWSQKNTAPVSLTGEELRKFTQMPPHPLSISELQVFVEKFRALIEFGRTQMHQIAEKYQMTTPEDEFVWGA